MLEYFEVWIKIIPDISFDISRKRKLSEVNEKEGENDTSLNSSKPKKIAKSEFVKEKQIEKELKQLKQTVEDMKKINQVSSRMSEEEDDFECSINSGSKGYKRNIKVTKHFKFLLGQKLSNLSKTDLIKVARMLEQMNINWVTNGRFNIDLDALEDKVWIRIDRFVNGILNEIKKVNERQSKAISDIPKKKNDIKPGLLISAKHNIIKPSIANQKYVEKLIKQTKDGNLSEDSLSSSSESSNIQESNNDNALDRLRQRNEIFNNGTENKQQSNGALEQI